MSPKFIVGTCLATGGVTTTSYLLFVHSPFTHAIQISATSQKPENLGSISCTTPTHKATITNDERVEYYICSEEDTQTSTSTADFTYPITGSVFSKTTPTTNQPAIWTYKQKNKSHSINIYWSQLTTTTKNIFFIKKQKNTDFNLSTKSDIRELIQEIEAFRLDQSITITTPSNTKTEDSISCTSTKTAVSINYPNTEYYVCTHVTEGTNATNTQNTPSHKNAAFKYDETFKTATDAKKTISRWLNKNTTKPAFYWFKPNSPSTDKEIFFLTQSTDDEMTDLQIKQLIFKIEDFKSHES